MQKYVKRDGSERLIKGQPTWDTKPYRDEYDFDLLRRMMAAYVASGSGYIDLK
jgi:hypothetical protein